MFREKGSVIGRMKNAISPKPVRDQVFVAIHKLRTQLNRIENTSAQLQLRDKSLYDRCVAAVKNNQPESARLYAEECNETRKIARITLNSQFALEKVVLRLDAVMQFGDMANEMSSLRGVISSISSIMSGVMPETSMQLADIDANLNEMTNAIGTTTPYQFQTADTAGEAHKILQEASALAEQRVKDRFPDLPSIESTESSTRPTAGPL